MELTPELTDSLTLKFSQLARDKNQKGESLLNKNDLEGALSYFLKALDMEPTFSKPHSNLGILHWKRGDQKIALKHFKKALEIQPDDEVATLFCGNALMKNGQHEETTKLFSCHLLHAPANLEINDLLAKIKIGLPSKNKSKGIKKELLNPILLRSQGNKTGLKRKKIIPESTLAHKWLNGMRGLEIGPSAHNPFGLKTINVGLQDEIYEREQISRAGKATRLDIIATADDIPVENDSQDFILGSHIIEHCPNFIKTLIEWFRIIKHAVLE